MAPKTAMQNSGAITWASISTIVGLAVAWVTITRFVLEPLETRIEVARQNYIRELVERDQRMDYLQQQIDELEHKQRRAN